MSPEEEMPKERINKEDIEQKRTPEELLCWVEASIDQVASTEDGLQAIRLREGNMKPIMEEVYPIAIFALKKYGETDKVKIRPIIGSQNYDAIITDYSYSTPKVGYLEVTQAHEGEVEYLRALHLQRFGYMFPTGTIKKEGTRKTGLQITTELEARPVIESAHKELDKILDSLKRKEGKEYPANTALIIVFDDGLMFRRVIDNKAIDIFIKNNVMDLDLQFNCLYLVGHFGEIFRQYELIRNFERINQVIVL